MYNNVMFTQYIQLMTFHNIKFFDKMSQNDEFHLCPPLRKPLTSFSFITFYWQDFPPPPPTPAHSPPLGSPDSFSPLFKSAPADPTASIVSGAHIYDTSPAVEMDKMVPPKPAGTHLYGVLEANAAPLYSSLTRASAEASKAPSLPHEYSSLNVPV